MAKTWAKVYSQVPQAPFNPASKDEQALTEAFEDFVGGPERGFRLMRLFTAATQSATLDSYRYGKQPTTEERFIKLAKENGFTEEETKAYLSLP